jgi:peptidoglycan/xylan/chitin deacetylase (PgdA/CDA1 family)
MTAVFTCSIDDGHPSDLRMAALLSKHGLRATFYIPLKNREGPPVMSADQIREVGQGFEIGSHTLDHCYLNSVGMKEAKLQIDGGKSMLEYIIERPVTGFCYPGGKFNRQHLDLVRGAGFQYARTTANLCLDRGPCPFEVPTTIQFYPHTRNVYLRNFLQFGNWNKRAGAMKVAWNADNWLERIYLLFDHACGKGGAFHLWAHSHEIDQLELWQDLDDFFGYVASNIPRPQRLDNHALATTTGR